MLEIGSSIDIAATAGTVWDILMDVRRYREWNPFIVEAWGSLGVGERVHVRVQSSLGLRLPFRATVLARCDARDLRWRGSARSATVRSACSIRSCRPRRW